MIDQELKLKFLDSLEEIPIISVACKRFGIGKATIYRWRSEDSDFALRLGRALKRGRNNITEAAESQLIKQIKQGSIRAIIYWLENNTKRYHKPKLPLPRDDGYRGVTNFIITNDKDDDEKLEVIN